MHQIVRVAFPLSKQLYKWILSRGNRRSRNDQNYRERNSQWPIFCPLKLDNQWTGDFAHRNTYFWSITSQGKLIAIFFLNIKYSPSSHMEGHVGNGNPLQYYCLGKCHGQRRLAGHSPWGDKSCTWLSDQNNSDNPREACCMLESMSSKVYNIPMRGLLNQ